LAQFQDQLLQAAARYGLSGLPALDDPTYVSTVVFDPAQPAGTPKARFNYLFPSSEAAMITVRLKPGMTQAERERATDLFREAVDDPAFGLRNGDYVVSGVPVIFDGLAETLSNEIFILLAIALAVMALVLAVAFRPPFRLLPLAIALSSTALIFGFLALVGGSLTMASIAVLPVLTGLAVDYAIQFQARFRERLEEGSSPARAAVEAAARGGPVIGIALLATAAGFVVLVLSPIPMIRGFGLLLVAGVLVAFGVALTAGLATLSMIRTTPTGSSEGALATGDPSSARIRPVRSGLGAAALATRGRRIRDFVASTGERAGGWGRSALATSISAPGKVLAAALVLAVAGWIAGTRTELVSDVRQLLPSNLPELQDVDRLEDATGVSGDVYVTVDAGDLTDPEVIAWMAGFEQRVLERNGYEQGVSTCQDEDVEICPGTTLATLFAGTDLPARGQIRELLDLLPEYFSRAVVDRDEDGDGGTALVGFGIRVMPFDDQKALIDDIRGQLDPPGTELDPPAGVDVEVVGLPVLFADANAALDANRYLLTGVGLVAIALVLLAMYRSAARALVPLIPIVLATGWSSLVLEAASVPLNPMSATLGALVVAIATEFSVILAARYHEERDAGSSMGEALRRTYARTGAAVAVSGATAIAGFAVLVASDVRMLRDFGLVTVFDLGVALAGVMLVLPAALVWAEGGLEPIRDRLRRRPRAAETAGP
jgi:hydrophobe/amphiphile efflux-3 (HAE3) family protein